MFSSSSLLFPIFFCKNIYIYIYQLRLQREEFYFETGRESIQWTLCLPDIFYNLLLFPELGLVHNLDEHNGDLLVVARDLYTSLELNWAEGYCFKFFFYWWSHRSLSPLIDFFFSESFVNTFKIILERDSQDEYHLNDIH